MKIDLATISLAKVLAEIGLNKLSGRLSIEAITEKNNLSIWYWEGNIVSVTGVPSIRAKLLLYEWISPRLAHALSQESISKPIGEKLRKVYELSDRQIEQLFQEQIAAIENIIALDRGYIELQKIQNAELFPWQEMTGQEISCLLFIKQNLTKNFPPQDLEELPEGTLTLRKKSSSDAIALDELEKQIFQQANTNKTINQIAKDFKIKKILVQQRVYILELIGIVETTLTNNKILELTQNLVLTNSPKDEPNLERDNWRKPLTVIASCNLMIILGLFLGLFQDIERGILDRFFRWRGTEANQQITLVTVSDEDINKIQAYPIPDAKLAQTIENIKQHNPTAIGLDLYRDVPQNPGHDKLLEVYRTTPNLIGVEKVVGNKVFPPPILAEQKQVGFSDLLLDNDGVSRRALMSLNSNGNNSLSLGTYLALFFLNSKGIEMKQTAPNLYTIGDVKLAPLSSSSGGYWQEDFGGLQILLNYQSQLSDFAQISFWDAYNNEISASLITDRIVIIGTIADSKKDYFSSPYTNQKASIQLIPGVVIHANVASQLISAVLENRPLLKVWWKWQEIFWVLIWSVLGIGLGIAFLSLNVNLKQYSKVNTPLIIIAKNASFLIIALIVGYIAFLIGWWIPVFTPFLALTIGHNITSLQYQKELQNLFYFDKTTKVFNRSYFKKILNQKIVEHQKNQRNLALIFCQLENLDKYGKKDSSQAVIDYLRESVEKIDRLINHQKYIARYGFNTFAILISEIDSKETKETIRAMKEQLTTSSNSLLSDRSDSANKINYRISSANLTPQIDSPLELIANALLEADL